MPPRAKACHSGCPDPLGVEGAGLGDVAGTEGQRPSRTGTVRRERWGRRQTCPPQEKRVGVMQS